MVIIELALAVVGTWTVASLIVLSWFVLRRNARVRAHEKFVASGAVPLVGLPSRSQVLL